jgi:hypothetical protein
LLLANKESSRTVANKQQKLLTVRQVFVFIASGPYVSYEDSKTGGEMRMWAGETHCANSMT